MLERNNWNQWPERFVEALRKECGHDPVCVRIASDQGFAQKLAIMVWSYVDKGVTRELYSDRKIRMSRYQEIAEQAADGVALASILYARRDPEKAAFLDTIAVDLRHERDLAKELQATKRHGRDRDHGLLDLVHRELELYLGERITFATLANVVTAGFRADEQDESVDEDLIRKNLTRFREDNPHWNCTVQETKVG